MRTLMYWYNKHNNFIKTFFFFNCSLIEAEKQLSYSCSLSAQPNFVFFLFVFFHSESPVNRNRLSYQMCFFFPTRFKSLCVCIWCSLTLTELHGWVLVYPNIQLASPAFIFLCAACWGFLFFFAVSSNKIESHSCLLSLQKHLHVSMPACSIVTSESQTTVPKQLRFLHLREASMADRR